MKEIKTVTCPMRKADWFDQAINELLRSGWTLTKRDLLNVPGTLSEAFNAPVVQVLYAELVRDRVDFEEITS